MIDFGCLIEPEESVRGAAVSEGLRREQGLELGWVYCPDMDDLERWYTLMQDLPGMIRFAMVAASIATVIVIACLITIAVQLGRVVTAIDESGRRIPPGSTSTYPGPPQPGQPPTYGAWGPRQP